MNEEIKHIKSLKKGSYTSFTFIYHKYVGLLYSFVFNIVSNKDTAQDIVQETFIKIWSTREQIDENKIFRNYIFTIAKHLLLNGLRSKINNTLPLDSIHEEDLTNDTIDNNDTIQSKLDKISFAKKKLPPRQLQLFEMNKEQGLSISEIMDTTNLSEQSVRNQIHLAIKTIRKHIQTIIAIFWM